MLFNFSKPQFLICEVGLSVPASQACWGVGMRCLCGMLGRALTHSEDLCVWSVILVTNTTRGHL